MNSRWYRMSAIIAAAFVAGLAACTEPLAGPDVEPEDHLLFLSTRDGALDTLGLPLREIYRMKADGSGARNLSRHPGRGYDGMSLSPDGRRIVFVSDRETSGCDIWVMDTDGANLSRLTGNTPGERCNNWPRWSPDGTRIAFVSNREMRQSGSTIGLYDVYVMNADGSNPQNVSRSLGEALGNNVRVVGWSPARQIIFSTSAVGDSSLHGRVYVVNADGTGMRPLFDRAGDHSPAWSPDGSLVAFIRASGGNERLYVMNSDGTGVRPLTSYTGIERLSTGGGLYAGTGADVSPWSPDGEWIALERWDGIVKIRFDGMGFTRLTNFSASFNGWSASGAMIALTRRMPSEPDDVFVINADGSNLRNLTSNSPSEDSDALWIRN